MSDLRDDKIIDKIITKFNEIDIKSLQNLISFLQVEPVHDILSILSGSEKIEPLIKPEDTLYNADNSVNRDILKKVMHSFNVTRYYLNFMNAHHFTDIYKYIEQKYPQLQNQVIIRDETNNNIRTCTVTIGENSEILKFVFDIEIIIVGNYNIATVHELKVNNVDKLYTSFYKHQLYKSTGTSRGIGQGYGQDETYAIKDKWLPYNGTDDRRISKSEDIYERDFNFIIQNMNINADEIVTKFITKINEIFPKIPDLLKYKRIINESYAISSYLLNKYNFIPNELTEEQLEQHKKQLNLKKSNLLFGSMFGSPKDSKFYYQKYLKYKQKYLELKNKNLNL